MSKKKELFNLSNIFVYLIVWPISTFIVASVLLIWFGIGRWLYDAGYFEWLMTLGGYVAPPPGLP